MKINIKYLSNLEYPKFIQPYKWAEKAILELSPEVKTIKGNGFQTWFHIIYYDMQMVKRQVHITNRSLFGFGNIFQGNTKLKEVLNDCIE